MITPRHAAMGPDTGPADRARRDAAPLMPGLGRSFPLLGVGVSLMSRSRPGAMNNCGCLLRSLRGSFAPALSGISQRVGAFLICCEQARMMCYDSNRCD